MHAYSTLYNLRSHTVRYLQYRVQSASKSVRGTPLPHPSWSNVACLCGFSDTHQNSHRSLSSSQEQGCEHGPTATPCTASAEASQQPAIPSHRLSYRCLRLPLRAKFLCGREERRVREGCGKEADLLRCDDMPRNARVDSSLIHSGQSASFATTVRCFTS